MASDAGSTGVWRSRRLNCRRSRSLTPFRLFFKQTSLDLRFTMGQDHLCLTDNPFLPSCCSKLPRLSTSQCAASLPCLGSHDLLVDGHATRRHIKADSSMFTNDLDLRRATATGIFVASSLVVPAGNIALTHPVNPLPTQEKAEK